LNDHIRMWNKSWSWMYSTQTGKWNPGLQMTNTSCSGGERISCEAQRLNTKTSIRHLKTVDLLRIQNTNPRLCNYPLKTRDKQQQK
jgi:hypothetical protein